MLDLEKINKNTPEPRPSLDKPMPIVAGWEIYRWTGWKENYAIADYKGKPIDKFICRECGKVIEDGEAYFLDDYIHFECAGEKKRVVGQWLAIKRGSYQGPVELQKIGPNEFATDQKSDDLFAYSSVPGNFGLFSKHNNFNIEPQGDQKLLTPESTEEELEKARIEGLERLVRFINALQNLLECAPYGSRIVMLSGTDARSATRVIGKGAVYF